MTDELTADYLLREGANESLVWIDDHLLQDEGVSVRLSTKEPAMPSVRNIGVTIPGRHGAYDFGGYLEPREFTLDIVFPRQSYTELKRQIRQFNRLFVDDYGRPKTVKLRFGDEIDKYYNVRVTGSIPVDRTAERGFVTVPLTAYDPYAYSRVNANEVTWGSEVVTFEWNYLLGMGGTGGNGKRVTSPETIPVYVDGEALRPVFEISGRAKGLSVSANGKTFKLPDFNDDLWIIDGERYVVSHNGDERLDAMTGDFIALKHGDNGVKIGGRSLDVEITIKYRDKFV